ncbi:CaiB/BaiF CoA-transferase family protein [Sphingopyxis sp. JAI128]|uniref:CaiB/BaiF CoA transferase family protein n=1 Tax=Sphingopyxis sp. JAI128 TaxID=2723066 RepID=UPI0016144AB7|nr:CoA transferase [Sphingopyxis sp. JAI128]MBB6427143.1 formyl-CoA transferase [Sphingopyxis sp. JAI128]
MSATETSSQHHPDGAPLPLAGLLVLDLTLARAGPTCVRHLADWGADVIRVQPPDTGDEEVIGRRDGSDYQNMHRGKRVVTLDLKTATGHAAFIELVKRADVLVENMRAPVKHRLGIEWEALREVNPRLVYGSISGFGQTGPYTQRAGVDQIAQGMSGLMSITGAPGGGPMRVGIAVADLTSGNLLALAIMMALYQRDRTGLGRWVHTSLLESQIFMLDFQAARYLQSGVVPVQVGNDHPTAVPTGVFPTSDGFINIGASSSRQWTNLCRIVEPGWLDRPDWQSQADRSRDRAAVHDAIAAKTAEHTTEYWVGAFEEVGIPCGPIYGIDEVFDDPQVRHLDMTPEIEHERIGRMKLIGSPLNFDGSPRQITEGAKTTGVDTVEVLRWIGYDDERIEAVTGALPA